MEITQPTTIEVLSARMLRCPGKLSAALKIQLNSPAPVVACRQIMIDLATYDRALFLLDRQGDQLYFYPADKDVVLESSDYFGLLDHLKLGESITDIPFESYEDHDPGSTNPEVLMDVYPEVNRIQ